MPQGYLDEPELDVEFLYILDAFWLLSASRQIGFGLGYIPLSEVESYCRLFTVPDPRELVIVIRELDKIWLERQQEKEKK